MTTTEEKFFFNTEANKASFGINGFKKLITGQSYTGAFVAIQALDTSDVIAGTADGNGDAQFDDSLTAGTTIYGNFNNLSVSSGKVLIYLV